ncbi:efflux transporter periplasmic adaptor subunit [Edwardsiella hoshinae]|uniref:Efflux transporter periplasmic adaptor subunit n=1 Tax=Edwardsiella hoshinae TaxID=93378 RepID=A0ABM6EIV9_9GAMM|nr:efflux RND transporter periplasmic adaptor subunit [Edwardsiella hoshinae]AOV96901.1 efflux transporter periplasmic adaptor subunit [Edwardsiella hoshinae]
MPALTIKYATAVVGGLILGGLISVGLYAYLTPPAAPPPAPAERRVLFWYDPMKPDVKFDQPGKSPFMDMDLVAKYADEGEPQDADQGVRIDPAQQQNLGLKTAKVRQGRLTNVSVLPANIRFNEYQYVIMQARAEGFVEKVYPLTNGDRITRGSPLVDITIPAWVEAQSEYLLLMPGAGQEAQRQGVLERLRLSGMPEADIQRLRTTRRIQTRFTLRAPLDGVITAFDLRAGMNFSKDKVVAQIQGIDPVWVSVALPEAMAAQLNAESRFELEVPAYPQQRFTVLDWRALPSADPTTRTLQIRLSVANADGRLRPGMNATLRLETQSPAGLLIPAQAIVDNGAEQHVITVTADGRFLPKRVAVVQTAQQQAAIAAGLTEGESVVVNGLFLIDSEASINGALARMRPASEEASPAASASADDAAAQHAGH